MYRYWLKLRPAMPGAIPKKGLENIVNYDARTYEPSIGQSVWGYVEYSEQLSKEDMYFFDLVKGRDEEEKGSL